jgi:hypothetical protein
MRKRFYIPLALLFLACLSLMAFSEDRPAMKQCASIYVRSSEGWWLSINDDGSGSYGFGTGMARVEVVKNTFSFKQVYAAIEKVFAKKPENAEEPYMAVSYYREGTSSAVEHRLAQDRRLLTRLFLLARANVHPPANEFDTRSHNQVESFWRNNPWKESPHVFPNSTHNHE